MALKVKPVALAADKWDDNAARSAEQFAREAEASADLWQKNTLAAEQNFHKAITAAGISQRFAGGIRRAGAAKFARKIRDVARDRFAGGIHAAKQDYSERVTPFLDEIARLTLSPRAPRGDPANYRRVEEVGKALNAKRIALLGGGGPRAAS